MLFRITFFGAHSFSVSLYVKYQAVRMLLLYSLVVFMGSRKYPNDNDFDVYISEHGGSSNAFTECEEVSVVTFYCYVSFTHSVPVALYTWQYIHRFTSLNKLHSFVRHVIIHAMHISILL